MENTSKHSSVDISKHLKHLPNWQAENGFLQKDFIFKNSKYAFAFVTLITIEAETRNHHPLCTFCYNKVGYKITTHSANNEITEKDLKLAIYIEENKKHFL